MLFYVLVAFILITSTNSLIFVHSRLGLCLSRVVHAYVHTGSNDLDARAPRRWASAPSHSSPCG